MKKYLLVVIIFLFFSCSENNFILDTIIIRLHDYYEDKCQIKYNNNFYKLELFKDKKSKSYDFYKKMLINNLKSDDKDQYINLYLIKNDYIAANIGLRNEDKLIVFNYKKNEVVFKKTFGAKPGQRIPLFSGLDIKNKILYYVFKNTLYKTIFKGNTVKQVYPKCYIASTSFKNDKVFIIKEVKDRYTDNIRISKFISIKKGTKTWIYRYEYVLYDLIEEEEIISGKLSKMPFKYKTPRKIVWSKDNSKVYIYFYSSTMMN